jgi:hypothetical protein
MAILQRGQKAQLSLALSFVAKADRAQADLFDFSFDDFFLYSSFHATLSFCQLSSALSSGHLLVREDDLSIGAVGLENKFLRFSVATRSSRSEKCSQHEARSKLDYAIQDPNDLLLGVHRALHIQIRNGRSLFYLVEESSIVSRDTTGSTRQFLL